MKKYIFLIFTFCISTLYAQNERVEVVVTQNENGGSFKMDIDKAIFTELSQKEEAVCEKIVPPKPRELSPAEKCATQQKIMGYKIQVLYTKDRNAAEKVKNHFAKNFPSLTVELRYNAPDYKILVGDYFTKQSASSDLKRIQRTYPSAFSIQDRIWCRKAI